MGDEQVRRMFSAEPSQEDIDWCVDFAIKLARGGVPMDKAIERAVAKREKLKRDVVNLEFDMARAREERARKLREEGKPTLEHKPFAGLIQRMRKGK